MEIPKINEIVNYLQANAPERLIQLQTCFPEQADVFIVDIQGVSDPALKLRAEVSLAAMEEIQPKAISLLAVALDKNRRAERSEDVAAVLTTISAFLTAVVALLKADHLLMMVLVAGLTLISSLWTLLAKRQRRAFFAKDLLSHARALASSVDKAKQIASDLRIYLNITSDADYSDKVIPLIDSANAIAQQVIKAQMDLRQFPEYALV
jgi:hypothetical protein